MSSRWSLVSLYVFTKVSPRWGFFDAMYSRQGALQVNHF